MNTTPLLETRGLGLRVGRRQLLSGLDLRLEPGQLWCLLGPNGSGKTTLLHTLAGLQPPAEGALLCQGRPLAQWPGSELARLRGLLPQTLHDAFSAPVLDIVLLGRHPHLSRWAWEGADDRARARSALDAVDLRELAQRDVTSLSGGERQRVGIAALLAQDPRLLLLDEPVAHLDLRHQIGLLQHLRRLAAEDGKAVLLSLHDLNLAHRFGTHALLLAGDGGTPVQGPVDDAMHEATLGTVFGHPVQRATLADRVVFVAR